MNGNMDSTPNYHGSLIAFEGTQETISTQLRLLPSSSKILIIPPLQYFVKSDAADSPFDARSYILRIHEASNSRAEIARSFLRYGTPDNKRLAFMHGGTASARLNCITAISVHATNGDLGKAEAMFIELVRDGVAGLKKQDEGAASPKSNPLGIVAEVPGELNDEILDDPVSKAMRAADALDRETASLQPTNELDLTIGYRPRSTSVPILHTINDFQGTAPFYVFGGPGGRQGLVAQGTKGNTTGNLSLREIHDSRPGRCLRVENWRVSATFGGPNTEPTSSNYIEEAYSGNLLSPPGRNLVSPQSTAFGSVPNTPAVIGEAQLVDVRSSHKRISSLGRTHATAYHDQDISLSKAPTPAPSKLEDTQDEGNDSYTTNTLDSPWEEKPVLRSRFFSEIPRPVFNKPSRSSIRRSPPSPLNLENKTIRRPASYVDQSTNLKSTYVSRSTSTSPGPTCQSSSAQNGAFHNLEDKFEPEEDEQSQIILPMVEDFVLHFKGDEDPYPQLDDAIKALKESKHSVSMQPLLRKLFDEGLKQLSVPTPRESTSTQDYDSIAVGHSEVREAAPLYQPDPGEYDPFASHGDYLQPSTAFSVNQGSSNSTDQTVIGSTPPSPAQTLSHADMPPQKTFHELNTTGYKTAICIQNSLRSILNTYFSPEDIGYHQLNFPLLPEFGSLWEPVFREAEPGSPRNVSRKIDLILAIGAQAGVDREFLGAITTSLEKLGTRPNGNTRSGRLDFRFLIANAMQGFTARPLTEQTQDNPFSNPLLLATLIIPHLETYMAAHSSVRFLLLEYPREYLSTVLALQRMVGVDLLKVAGILNSEANEPKPYRGFKPSLTTAAAGRSGYQHSAAVSISGTSTASASATLLAPAGNKFSSSSSSAAAEAPPSFAKANFLLTSRASESEVATLISTIWKILIDISAFYIPEDTVSPPIPPASPSSMRDPKQKQKQKQGSGSRPLVIRSPLIDNSNSNNTNREYAPLASAAAMLGFRRPADEPRITYVTSATNTALAPAPAPHGPSARPLGPPAKKTITSIKSGTRPRSKLVKTMRGGEVPPAVSSSSSSYSSSPSSSSSYFNSITDYGGDEDGHGVVDDNNANVNDDYDYDEDDDDEFAADERRYMPLWRQQNQPQQQQKKDEPRRGNTRKALKWLGLSN
ncbi:hypothetical protein F5X99DRAFT_421648 [Biscogniauxia marginata]|nr:hypothetical protein F5X99DRAFT_421648 [Biscogniauxia marginata]